MVPRPFRRSKSSSTTSALRVVGEGVGRHDDGAALALADEWGALVAVVKLSVTKLLTKLLTELLVNLSVVSYWWRSRNSSEHQERRPQCDWQKIA